MLSNLSAPFDLALLIVGGIFLLKKVIDMDRYFALRVAILTSILSCAFIYYSMRLAPEYIFTEPPCVIDLTPTGDQF